MTERINKQMKSTKQNKLTARSEKKQQQQQQLEKKNKWWEKKRSAFRILHNI